MPTIRVELLEGRTPESVDILLYDIQRPHWATSGVQWSERT